MFVRTLSLLSLSSLLVLAMACEGGVGAGDDGAQAPPEQRASFGTAPSTGSEERVNPDAPAGQTPPPGGFAPPAEEGTAPAGGGTGTPEIAPPAEDTGLNCKEVYDQVSACYTTYYTCASACGDQGCADDCEVDYISCYGAQVALGSSTAQADFDALRSCEDTHWDECYASGGELYEACATACSDETCTNACANDANEVLQGCMADACQSAYDACGVSAGDETSSEDTDSESGGNAGTPAPPSGMNCAQLYSCEDGCKGNESCGQACYDNGTESAKSQWTNLIQCGITYCNGQVASADEYQTCLSELCPQEYGVCFGGGGNSGGNQGAGASGGMTCGEGYNCIQTCYSTAYDESSFYSCVNGCDASMGSQAKALMDSLTSCADAQCYDVPGSLANYYKCIEDFCTSEYMACIDQPASSSGTTGGGGATSGGIETCLDVHESVLDVCVPEYSTCMAGCADQGCADACGGSMAACIQAQQNAAPYQAGQEFAAVLSCRQANYDTCNAEADAVLATCDAACAPGDQACLDGCMSQSDLAYEACYTETCASEYAICGINAPGSGGANSGGSVSPAESHDSCLAIYEAVQAVCDAGYVSCTETCADQACADACAEEANACVDTQIQSAAEPSDGSDYEAVLGCWGAHYETCYASGGEVFEGCMAECTAGEDACKQSCNEPAMAAYAECYQTACASEYATCGIE